MRWQFLVVHISERVGLSLFTCETYLDFLFLVLGIHSTSMLAYVYNVLVRRACIFRFVGEAEVANLLASWLMAGFLGFFTRRCQSA
jgi:hypothetical protein